MAANHLVGASETDIRDAIEPQADPDQSGSEAEQVKSKSLERIMGIVKRASKRGVHLFQKIDQAKASHGNVHAQARLDVSQTTDAKVAQTGPITFPARYEGAAGYVNIATVGPHASISWRSYEKTSETSWVVPIAEIEDLSKVDGMSFKTKHFVQWALDTESINGLLMITRGDKRFHLTEIVRRDEVFNRLIAIGSQMWEVC